MSEEVAKEAANSFEWVGFVTPLLPFFLGFVTAVFSEPIRRWIFSPLLRLSFEKNGNCVSHTPVQNGGKEYEAYYIRLKVENKKRPLAKACRAYLIDVEKQDENGIWKPTIYTDSLPLAWSCQERSEVRRALDLPYSVVQYVDIVATNNLHNNYSMQVTPLPFRYHSLFENEPKTFRFTVLVAGDGVRPKTAKIIFGWKGKWDDFEVSSS